VSDRLFVLESVLSVLGRKQMRVVIAKRWLLNGRGMRFRVSCEYDDR